MFTKAVKPLGALAIAAGMLLAGAVPAGATSGGGCNSNASAASCISFSNPYLLPDFYINRSPDWSMTSLAFMLFVNNKYWKTLTTINPITRSGHYGPWQVNVANNPTRCQEAFARLVVLAGDGTISSQTDSPKIYYCA